jgi:hypothetical protein
LQYETIGNNVSEQVLNCLIPEKTYVNMVDVNMVDVWPISESQNNTQTV